MMQYLPARSKLIGTDSFLHLGHISTRFRCTLSAPAVCSVARKAVVEKRWKLWMTKLRTTIPANIKRIRQQLRAGTQVRGRTLL